MGRERSRRIEERDRAVVKAGDTVAIVWFRREVEDGTDRWVPPISEAQREEARAGDLGRVRWAGPVSHTACNGGRRGKERKPFSLF